MRVDGPRVLAAALGLASAALVGSSLLRRLARRFTAYRLSLSQLPVPSKASRTVHCEEAVAWLQRQETLPATWCVVTSLPDICEVQPRLRTDEYESWFIETVRLVLSKIDARQAAIFYQTDGRTSGADGTYLDKSLLCHLGARAAGARCVWHRIVCSGLPGELCHGRVGFVHMLCFSAGHRAPAGPAVDVLERGHMSWARAMGHTACEEAVKYAGRHLTAHGEPTVCDPFCGCGSVLHAANACGLEAVGVDLSAKRCRVASRYQGPLGMAPGKRAARRTGRQRRVALNGDAEPGAE